MRSMRSMDGRSWRRGGYAGDAGYTMTELVITLTLIGIVAGFAAPRIDYQRYRADAGARVVRGVLQQAQRLAVLRQYDVIVSFDVANDRVRVIEDANNNRSQDGAERGSWKPLAEGARFARPAAAGIGGTMVDAEVTGADVRQVGGYSSITFHRDGAASTDLEVYITAGSSVESNLRGIAVTQSTGRADAYRYNPTNPAGSKWLGSVL
ncbi:MAG TPA: type II secretion system protein [Gemmatimonadaceae bacterium]|nr:type II secretion system protein [Gemmatimonadaceae bacterium]